MSEETVVKFTVDADQAGTRLDMLVTERLGESRSHCQQIIKEGAVLVNNKVAKCGKIPDGKAETIPMQQRVNIYQCQTTMTNERISYLIGDNE